MVEPTWSRQDQSFELLGTNELEELCLSSPAVSGGKLLIRTVSKTVLLVECKE